MDSEPDLSHLSESERKIIMDVLQRQKKDDSENVKVLKTKTDERIRQASPNSTTTDAKLTLIKSPDSISLLLSNQQASYGEICAVCHMTKFADASAGKLCQICTKRVCSRCCITASATVSTGVGGGGGSDSDNLINYQVCCKKCEKRKVCHQKTKPPSESTTPGTTGAASMRLSRNTRTESFDLTDLDIGIPSPSLSSAGPLETEQFFPAFTASAAGLDSNVNSDNNVTISAVVGEDEVLDDDRPGRGGKQPMVGNDRKTSCPVMSGHRKTHHHHHHHQQPQQQQLPPPQNYQEQQQPPTNSNYWSTYSELSSNKVIYSQAQFSNNSRTVTTHNPQQAQSQHHQHHQGLVGPASVHCSTASVSSSISNVDNCQSYYVHCDATGINRSEIPTQVSVELSPSFKRHHRQHPHQHHHQLYHQPEQHQLNVVNSSSSSGGFLDYPTKYREPTPVSPTNILINSKEISPSDYHMDNPPSTYRTRKERAVSRRKLEALLRHDSLSSDYSEATAGTASQAGSCHKPPIASPTKLHSYYYSASRKVKQNSFSSSEDDLPTSIDCASGDDKELEIDSLSELDTGISSQFLDPVNRKNVRLGQNRSFDKDSGISEGHNRDPSIEMMAQMQYSNYSIHGYEDKNNPVTWKPSKDTKRLIGHMILRKGNSSSPAPGGDNNSGILGLKVTGGEVAVTGQCRAYIIKVKPDSIADIVGHLLPGDEVIEWNGISFRGLSNKEVNDIISDSKYDPSVELIVQRNLEKYHQQSQYHSQEVASLTGNYSINEGLKSQKRYFMSPSPENRRNIVASVQMRMCYNSIDLQFSINLISGTNLSINQPFSTCSSFVKITFGNEKRESRVIHQTSSPFWDQEFVFRGVTENFLKGQDLYLTVFNYDQSSCRSIPIAELIIDMDKADYGNRLYSYPLTPILIGRTTQGVQNNNQTVGGKTVEGESNDDIDTPTPIHKTSRDMSISSLSPKHNPAMSDRIVYDNIEMPKYAGLMGATESLRSLNISRGGDGSLTPEQQQQQRGSSSGSRTIQSPVSPSSMGGGISGGVGVSGVSGVGGGGGPCQTRFIHSEDEHQLQFASGYHGMRTSDDHHSNGSNTSLVAVTHAREMSHHHNPQQQQQQHSRKSSVQLGLQSQSSSPGQNREYVLSGYGQQRRGSYCRSSQIYQQQLQQQQQQFEYQQHKSGRSSSRRRDSVESDRVRRVTPREPLARITNSGMMGGEDSDGRFVDSEFEHCTAFRSRSSLSPPLLDAHYSRGRPKYYKVSSDNSEDPSLNQVDDGYIFDRRRLSEEQPSLLKKKSSNSSSIQDATVSELEQLNTIKPIDCGDGTNDENAEGPQRLPLTARAGESERKRRPSIGQKFSSVLRFSKKSSSTSNLEKKARTSFQRSEEVVPAHVRIDNAKISTGTAEINKFSFTERSEPVRFDIDGHRDSEENIPNEEVARCQKTGSIIPTAKTSNSQKPSSLNHDHVGIFIEGLGPAQLVGRQVLGMPSIGELQLSFIDRRGRLDVEVIRARGLVVKSGSRSLPQPYVKLYLLEGKSVIEKQRTMVSPRRTVDPLYQQQISFTTDYVRGGGKVLQATVWGEYSRMDKKSFMGRCEVLLDDLDLSSIVFGWYKLYSANASEFASPACVAQVRRQSTTSITAVLPADR